MTNDSMRSDSQLWLTLGWEWQPSTDLFLKNCITDRGSKYSATLKILHSKDEARTVVKALKKNIFYTKATHNSYAYRVVDSAGMVHEWKNDDGETGAGMCILRELERAEVINCLVVITRYYGGVQLHADRFVHVINATKLILDT